MTCQKPNTTLQCQWNLNNNPNSYHFLNSLKFVKFLVLIIIFILRKTRSKLGRSIDVVCWTEWEIRQYYPIKETGRVILNQKHAICLFVKLTHTTAFRLQKDYKCQLLWKKVVMIDTPIRSNNWDHSFCNTRRLRVMTTLKRVPFTSPAK